MDGAVLAYILKTVDYQEHSKLVYYYCETGIHSALARGVKKLSSPFRHAIQPGNLVQLTLTKGKLPSVKEAELSTYFFKIKEDLIKSTITSIINELIYYNVSKEDNHHKLFHFVVKLLQRLNDTNDALELLMIFEMKFLYFLGYGIDFKACHVCQSEEALYFNTHTSMVACKVHTELGEHILSEETFLPLKYFLHCDILAYQSLSLSSETLNYLMQIIDGLYAYHLGNHLKSKKILYTLL